MHPKEWAIVMSFVHPSNPLCCWYACIFERECSLRMRFVVLPFSHFFIFILFINGNIAIMLENKKNISYLLCTSHWDCEGGCSLQFAHLFTLQIWGNRCVQCVLYAALWPWLTKFLLNNANVEMRCFVTSMFHFDAMFECLSEKMCVIPRVKKICEVHHCSFPFPIACIILFLFPLVHTHRCAGG